MEKIVENIKKIRAKKGYSQEYMAEKLKREQVGYSLIENGKRKLKYETLEQIAMIFEMPVIDIITYPDIYICSKKTDDVVDAILQIKLMSDKKDQVLKLIFGDNNLEIFSK
jgi:transcriptional regulator with XRE-family HTH domain